MKYAKKQSKQELCFGCFFLNRYSLGILDSEEMVKKYAKSADQKVVALIQKWLANRYSEFQTKKTHMVCYATKEGLRRFAEQGIVDDQEIHLPQEVYFSSLNESAANSTRTVRLF